MRKYRIIILSVLTLASIVFSGTAGAEEIKFHASLDRNIIYLGQSVQLNLKFQGLSGIPAPDPPDIDGFRSRYIGPSTRRSIVNGKMSSSVTHIYRLIPVKTGKFEIPSISFENKGDTYVSDSLTIEVLDGAASGRSRPFPESKSKSSINLNDRVFVTMGIPKSSVYKNEMIPLTIKLYISNISVRDIRYPEFIHEGFSAGEFEKPRQYQESKGGVIYDVVEFKTKIFAIKAGEFSLGPAKVKANMVTERKRRRRSDFFDDFFGTYEAHPVELESEKKAMKVLSLPDEGRPADFKGAVGDFNLNLSVSPSEVRVGDPVTVKMIVGGKGNFNTVSSPALKQKDGFKVYDPQVKQNGDNKIFEQVLIPVSDSVKGIPEISFSFFNTGKGRYQRIVKRGIPLKVLRPEKKEQIAILEAPVQGEKPAIKEVFGRDIIYIKESPGKLRMKNAYLYKSAPFILLHILPVLLFVSAWMFQKRREKLSSDIGYARRLAAPKKARKGIHKAEQYLNKESAQEFYDSVFKTTREYLGDRFHIPSGGITSDVVDNTLKARNIHDDILGKLRNIFKECDMARYAPSALTKANMEGTLKNLKEAIDYLEKHR
ncbi:MAG: BatD family protein [Candidatus Scalindua sp.]